MISVCIATCNGEKYIKEQLDSILPQLGENDEIIISDDNSVDNTIDIIQSYNDTRIKFFFNKKENKGYTYNFENALLHVSGDYIFLSDQDDIWVENKVQVIQSCLQEMGNVLIMTDAFMTDADGNIQKQLSEWRHYRKGFWKNLYKGVYVGCTMAFTKEMLQYFLPIPSGLYGHDVWFGLLSELKYKIVYIKQPLIYYRRHDSVHSFSGKKSKNSIWFMFKYRFDFFVEVIKKRMFYQ